MCAIKEVKVISDDSTSKECLKQLNQVILIFKFVSVLVNASLLCMLLALLFFQDRFWVSSGTFSIFIVGAVLINYSV